MAAIDFPASPANGATFTPANGVTYRYVTPPGIWVTVNGPVDTVIASDTPPSNPTPNQLWFNATLASLFVYYDDGTSKQWVPAMPIPAPAAPGGGAVSSKLTKFLANGTWTPDPKLLFGEMRCKGGGAGGGGVTTPGGWSSGAGGGGEGATAVKYFSNVGLNPSYTVTVAATAGGDADGGVTSVGALCVANGGLKGGGGAGMGGSTGTGDIIIPGAPGGMSWMNTIQAQEYGTGGSGGGSGGGTGGSATGSGGAQGVAAIANSGAGGGGGAARNTGTGLGGTGGSGYVTIVEYLKA